MRFLTLSVVAQLASAVSLTQYHHKARHAAVVLDNTIYIDGGEIAHWNGSGTGLYNSSITDNNADTNTYYIDLGSNWSNSSISIVTIPKNGAPTLQSEGLWYHNRKEAFVYDGGVSLAHVDNSPRPNNALWSLDPGNQTRWTQDFPSGNFSTLVRVLECSYASGNSLGFALGGYETAGTESITGKQFVPGMVMYNMTSGAWYNVSAGGDYARGSVNGAAHLITSFGTEGIFIVLGGTTQQNWLDLDRATLFDPVSQQWRTQRVSGDYPAGALGACATGVPGDNGTYEIFFYGGLQAPSGGYQVSDGSVYVLSLPAFHWYKAPATVSGRYFHSCNAVGKNNRQMIVAGGIVVPGPLDATDFSTLNTGGPDPWPNGLGVFDLTALQWKSQYAANADNYVTPDPIKAWYEKNGMYPNFDDDLVKTWFQTKNSVGSSNSTSSSTPSATATPSPSGISGGAIAGIVIGVVAVIAIVLLAVWLLRRRHRQKQAALARPDSVPPSYSAGTHNPAEAHPQAGFYGHHETKQYAAKTSPYPVEAPLDQHTPPLELESMQVHELEDHHRQHELDTSRK